MLCATAPEEAAAGSDSAANEAGVDDAEATQHDAPMPEAPS